MLFNQALAEFAEQVRQVVRYTDEPEDLNDPMLILKQRMSGQPVLPPKKIKPPVPYEMVLKSDFEHYYIPPVAGALFDQPHILLTCFHIIDTEEVKWAEEKRRVKAANERLGQANANKPKAKQR